MNNKNQSITLCIEQEKDIYNPFSPIKELRSEVITYITDKISSMDRSSGILIKVVSTKPLNEKNFTDALQHWFESIEQEIIYESRVSLNKQIIMFSVGTFFISLSLMLQAHIPVLPYTILSTIGAYSMWEAAALWIIGRPKIKRRRKIIDKYKSKYTVKFEVSGNE